MPGAVDVLHRCVQVTYETIVPATLYGGTTMTFDDDLTTLLDASAPRVAPPTLTEQVVLGHMAAALPAGRRPRTRRRTAIGLVVGAAVLGGGTAVATGVWDDAFVDPDLLYTFTAPSGAACEGRIVGPLGAEDPVGQALLEWAQSTDLVALADVERELAISRAGVTFQPDGSAVPRGPGTPGYDADREYADAVHAAVSRLIFGRLEAQEVERTYTFNSEILCDRADW